MDGFMKRHSGAHSGMWGNRRFLQIKTEEKFSEKLLCDMCIPLRELYLFFHKAVFEHCSCKTEKVVFGSTLKTMVKSEMSWNKTQIEALQDTALWLVHSFQRVKVYYTLPTLETLTLRNLWRDTKWCPEASGEQGNVFSWRLQRSFWSNCFLMCVFIS